MVNRDSFLVILLMKHTLQAVVLFYISYANLSRFLFICWCYVVGLSFYDLLQMTCILEFDGASKGNPGKSGAGAILRTLEGNVVGVGNLFLYFPNHPSF